MQGKGGFVDDAEAIQESSSALSTAVPIVVLGEQQPAASASHVPATQFHRRRRPCINADLLRPLIYSSFGHGACGLCDSAKVEDAAPADAAPVEGSPLVRADSSTQS